VKLASCKVRERFSHSIRHSQNYYNVAALCKNGLTGGCLIQGGNDPSTAWGWGSGGSCPLHRKYGNVACICHSPMLTLLGAVGTILLFL